jgi:hypothetical protein
MRGSFKKQPAIVGATAGWHTYTHSGRAASEEDRIEKRGAEMGVEHPYLRTTYTKQERYGNPLILR